jgi:serine/threonine protein kinase
MEYIEPSRLLNFIDFKARKTQFSLVDIRQIMKALGEAVLHCHEQGFILRDLTPANILVKRKGVPSSSESNSSLSSIPSQEPSPPNSPTTGRANLPVSVTLSQAATQLSSPALPLSPNPANSGYEVKIVDFSFAVRDGGHDFLGSHPLFEWSMVPYCAPEALLSPGHYHPTIASSSVVPSHFSFEMDMWALGVLLYVMISGEQPFGGYETSTTIEDHVLIHNIRHAQYNFERNSAWKECGEGVKKLIRKLLTVDRQHRLSDKEFVKSSWLEVGGSGASNNNLHHTGAGNSGKISPPIMLPSATIAPVQPTNTITPSLPILSPTPAVTSSGSTGSKEKSLSTSSPNAVEEEEEEQQPPHEEQANRVQFDPSEPESH